MEQFCSISLFQSKFDHHILYVNESKSLRRVSGQDPLICPRFRSSQRWWHFSPLSRIGKMTQFSLFESKFDHLLPYVNESKSLKRVSGQDPLICHRFRSSQRWWHFSPLSRLGKMELFAQYSLFESTFDHFIPNVNESKSLRQVSGQDPIICHRCRGLQRWWNFSPLSRLA